MNDPNVIVKPDLKAKEQVKRPSMYAVVLHNDSQTPRAFVVMALKRCFQKVEAEARDLMQAAHENGSAVVATFTREIAEMRAAKANDFSTKHGYVLLFTAEPAD